MLRMFFCAKFIASFSCVVKLYNNYYCAYPVFTNHQSLLRADYETTLLIGVLQYAELLFTDVFM